MIDIEKFWIEACMNYYSKTSPSKTSKITTLNQRFIDVDYATNTYKSKWPTNFIIYAKISIDELGKNANLKIIFISFIVGWHTAF